MNVLDPRQKLAVAPRLGVGYRGRRKVWLAEGGAIASYRAFDWFEPYLGLTFANHWIEPERSRRLLSIPAHEHRRRRAPHR